MLPPAPPFVSQQLFEAKLQAAVERVRVVLDVNRNPTLAKDTHHRYDDKYLLAESMTNAAAASQLNCFASFLGLSQDHLQTLRGWSKSSAVSLKFTFREKCEYDRMEKREVEDPTKHVTEVRGIAGLSLTSKTVTTVEDHFWQCDFSYEILAVRGVGAGPEDRLSLVTRAGRVELRTASSASVPRVAVPGVDFEVNVSWLLQNSDGATPCFRVDREHKACHTPRRNADVEAAFSHFGNFIGWAVNVKDCLLRLYGIRSHDAVPTHPPDDSAGLFVPVLPLMEAPQARLEDAPGAEAAAAAAASAHEAPAGLARLLPAELPEGSAMLAIHDTNRLLAEEGRTLSERRDAWSLACPDTPTVAGGSAEAVLVGVLRHCADVCLQWKQSLNYIEGMLRAQLVAAIGKEVSPADFAQYMRFHNTKLFMDAFAPSLFCYAVRRSDKHTPEGLVSIEEEVVGPGGGSTIAQPIVTLAAESTKVHPMEFPLSASVRVRFSGERHLHAWLRHQFSGQTGGSLSLVSKARQFSSFIVLVGRIGSARSFEPKYASIVQNKDELSIPLDLSTIPSAKEFKDAIESLSPEQQAFAKAFRSMQLESTLFGVLVIQIKPQLEKVLNLPSNSLTKEIKLTQELMQLFIQHQIPSDLLSYDPSAVVAEDDEGFEVLDSGGALGGAPARATASAPASPLEAVRGHVRAMLKVIEQAKREELEERRQEAKYEQLREVAQHSDLLHLLAEDEPRSVKKCSTQMKSAPRAKPRMAYSAPLMAMSSMMGAGMSAPGACAPPAPAAAATVAAVPPRAPRAAVSRSSAPPASAPPPPQATPPSQPSQPPRPSPPQQQEVATAEADGDLTDYTQVPKDLDARLEELDKDGALRPTIISPGEVWRMRSAKSLLAKPTEEHLREDAQKRARDEAFDLLDALTKSGALPVEHASLHVVVAATHCFDKTVTETVIQDNMNPIEKVERSTLIMASTIHDMPPSALIKDAERARVEAASPLLFLEGGAVGA